MGISLLFRSCLVYSPFALEWCSALHCIRALSHLGGSLSLSPPLAYSPPHFEFLLSPKHHNCAHRALPLSLTLAFCFEQYSSSPNLILSGYKRYQKQFYHLTPTQYITWSGEKTLVWNSSWTYWLVHHSRVPLTMVSLHLVGGFYFTDTVQLLHFDQGSHLHWQIFWLYIVVKPKVGRKIYSY